MKQVKVALVLSEAELEFLRWAIVEAAQANEEARGAQIRGAVRACNRIRVRLDNLLNLHRRGQLP